MKKPLTSPIKSSPKGFTLIELLTVIAIIGILASILIPVVGKVRESAKVSACAVQLRDLGLACHLYAEDHNDMLPPNLRPGENPVPENQWGNYIADRSLGLLLAPEKGGPLLSAAASWWGGDYLDDARPLLCPYSKEEFYAINDQFKRPEDINESNRAMRAGYIWVYYRDGDRRTNAKTTVENINRPFAFDLPLPGTPGLGPNFTINPHENRVNVLHVGGHVTSFDSFEVKNGNNGLNGLPRLFDFFTFGKWDQTH